MKYASRRGTYSSICAELGRPSVDRLTSDYQKLLPDSAGHDGTLLLASSDTS